MAFGIDYDAQVKDCAFLNNFHEFTVARGKFNARNIPLASAKIGAAILTGDAKFVVENAARSTGMVREMIHFKSELVKGETPPTPSTGGCPFHMGEGTKDMATRMLTTPDPETGEMLPESNVANQIITFLIAGHDSTSTALTMLLYNVAMNPDVEQKIYDEVIHLSRDHSRDFMRQRSG